MGTYREAIQHARVGGTARCGGKEIRFLTFEEAEPIILDAIPSRRTVIGANGKPLIEDTKIVVETFADPNFDTKKFGLYDVGVHPAAPFTPSDEDIYLPLEHDDEGNPKPRALRADWELLSDEKPEVVEPEVVAPEVVDEALSETIPETLGALDTEPPQ